MSDIKFPANYTMTFSDFLERFGDTPEWQKVKDIFAKFPAYQVSGDTSIITIYELFTERYKFREIGAETPSLFAHFCEDRSRELLVKYSWKLQLYNQEYNKVMGRSVSLKSDGNDYVYLFPVNSTAERLASKTKFDRTADAQIAGNLSNPELLTLSMNLRDIFIDVVAEFEPLFMGIF